ncbi:MAG: hypothetical protein JXJ22_16005 [Bacteroidales bacterium]|nr:hypothetical protein [Bacteroidales bacterium]
MNIEHRMSNLEVKNLAGPAGLEMFGFLPLNPLKGTLSVLFYGFML